MKTKQPPGMEMLAMKIREGDHAAAREYIRTFVLGASCDRDVMLSALAFAVADLMGDTDV
jgi:hypothetical protein